MTKEEEGKRILRFFAKKFDLTLADLFIAGGWAANPFRADDIDIWVYRPECVVSEDYYKKLGNLIHGATKYEMMNAEINDPTRKPTTYLEWYGKPVQIFETPFQIFELMDLFDLSCHQYALTHNGVLCRGENATHPVDDDIVVMTPDHSTPHRLNKVLERYGHNPTVGLAEEVSLELAEFALQECERDERERRWAEEAHKLTHEEANDGE